MPTVEDYLTLPNGQLCLKEHLKASELLDYLEAFIRKFVVITAMQAVVVSLWVIHTYMNGWGDTTPYLNIFSPEKRSGKTRLLELLEHLVNKPWLTGRVTPAVLARKIDKEIPTLLLDESDTAFKSNQEYSQTLRGILNSGYRRSGKYSVCVGQGTNIAYKDFSTYCPKAIAGIGSLPDTIADRSIPIELKRRSKSEVVSKFRLRDIEKEASTIRECIVRWVSEIHVTEANPKIPEELDDRAADCWEPLFMIAEAAGGAWPDRARAAALELMTGKIREDDSLGIRLLSDIKKVMEPSNQMFSTALLSALNQMEESPWGNLEGRPLDTRRLASLLKPFNIRPQTIRLDEETRKGYSKADFHDSWDRYLPVNDLPSVTAVTPDSPQAQSDTSIYPSQTPENTPIVTDKSQSYAECNVTDVTASTPKTEEKVIKMAQWDYEI